MAIIKVENLTFEYPLASGKALNNVSFDVNESEFCVICGKSGCGKSTLLRHLKKNLTPYGTRDGVVLYDGDNLFTLDDRRSASEIGFVQQNPDNQLVSSVVEDDVAFGPENIGVDPTEIRVRVDKALKDVGMYEHRKKGPHLLSGGQKQRIAIAGVLAMQPQIIVFDEPTAMLDPKGRKEILSIVKELHDSGKTIILITHFIEEAIEADRIIVMEKGKVKQDGTPREIILGGEVDLTFAAQLAQKLRDKGMNIPQDIFTEEELEKHLCSLK